MSINEMTLLFQVLNLLILVGWLVIAILALIRLRHRRMDERSRTLWVILILLVPLLGGLAFFLVRPGKSGRRQSAK